jgi:hypothetical protein
MELQNQVKDLVHKVPAPRKGVTIAGTTTVEIEKFARRNSIHVPEELQDWLLFCNGALLGPGGLYGLRPSDSFLDIEARWALHGSWKEKGWLPVAGDGCGNEYVLLLNTPDSVDHPVLFIDTSANPETPAYVVASGLWLFLKFLFLDELKLTHWPFDKEEVLAADPKLADYRVYPLPWQAEMR